MTSDSNPPDSHQESPVDNAMADAKAAFQKAGFSSPEGMVAFGGLILILGWVIFDLIMTEASLGHLPFFFAFAAVALHFGRGEWTSRIAARPVLMKALGYGLAIMGLVYLIWVLRFISSYNRIGEILAAVTFLAGYTVAFMGARSIST